MAKLTNSQSEPNRVFRSTAATILSWFLITSVLFVAATAAVTVPSNNHPCVDGESFWGGHCYHFNFESLSWDASQWFCRARGSYLVKIDGILENVYLQERLQAEAKKRMLPSSRLWMGLQRMGADRYSRYAWLVDGSLASYVPIGTTQSFDVESRCIAFKSNSSLWQDAYCFWALPSICERDPSQPSLNSTLVTIHQLRAQIEAVNWHSFADYLEKLNDTFTNRLNFVISELEKLHSMRVLLAPTSSAVGPNISNSQQQQPYEVQMQQRIELLRDSLLALLRANSTPSAFASTNVTARLVNDWMSLPASPSAAAPNQIEDAWTVQNNIDSSLTNVGSNETTARLPSTTVRPIEPVPHVSFAKVVEMLCLSPTTSINTTVVNTTVPISAGTGVAYSLASHSDPSATAAAKWSQLKRAIVGDFDQQVRALRKQLEAHQEASTHSFVVVHQQLEPLKLSVRTLSEQYERPNQTAVSFTETDNFATSQERARLLMRMKTLQETVDHLKVQVTYCTDKLRTREADHHRTESSSSLAFLWWWFGVAEADFHVVLYAGMAIILALYCFVLTIWFARRTRRLEELIAYMQTADLDNNNNNREEEDDVSRWLRNTPTTRPHQRQPTTTPWYPPDFYNNDYYGAMPPQHHQHYSLASRRRRHIPVRALASSHYHQQHHPQPALPMQRRLTATKRMASNSRIMSIATEEEDETLQDTDTAGNTCTTGSIYGTTTSASVVAPPTTCSTLETASNCYVDLARNHAVKSSRVCRNTSSSPQPPPRSPTTGGGGIIVEQEHRL